MVRRRKRWLLPVAVGLALTLASNAAARADTVAFQDQFTDHQPPTWAEGTTYVGTDGKWTLQFDGFGRVGEETDAIVDQPALALAPEPPRDDPAPQVLTPSLFPPDFFTTEHAALVTSHPSFGDSTLSLSMRTVAQTRQGALPNPWEVGWVLWHFQDDQHFYYLILKPNGWELGKEIPGGQAFLATGSWPVFVPGGPWNAVSVTQRTVPDGQEIVVNVNGQQLTDYTDKSSPYASGTVGLYDEDSYAHFSNVVVTTPNP